MTQTIQGLLDSMSAEERDIQAIVVAAAVTGVELDDAEITNKYNALPELHKYLIDFVAGHAMVEDSPVEHSAIYHSELAHFGVKGMRWGVRNDASSARSAARAKVKSGSGTLGDAHTAAMKSTGHRITNGVLGDKTFWKRTAITAGISAGVVGASAAAAFGLPTDVLTDIGRAAAGRGLGDNHITRDGSVVTNKEIGSAIVLVSGMAAAQVTAIGGTAVNYTSNAVRAIRGNARLSRDANNLGSYMKERQTAGSKAVQKSLIRNGSLRKRDVTHSEEYTLEGTLAHYGVRGMRWGQRSSAIKKARSDLKSGAKLGPIEKRQAARLATKRTAGETLGRRSKQLAVLAVGAKVVAAYLDINGDVTMSEASSSRPTQQSYEDAWKRDMANRDEPMFNPKARLDPSQVEVR